jgi:kynurenine formamidase
MHVLLSHPVTLDDPNWPGAPGLSIRPVNEIAKGDVANTHVVEIYSHYGTHVDVPYHFNPDGARLSDLGIDDFVFDRPAVLDLPLGEGQLVEARHIDRADADPSADLLIMRSGFERHRGNRERYVMRGPGFSAAAASRTRDAFPAVRAIALDWLSLAAPWAIEEGVEAHRELLGRRRDDRPILIFEDVRVSALAGRRPIRVVAAPILITGLDGFPCAIVAEVNSDPPALR